MAWPPLVILPTSTDGTKVMTIGLSGAPSSPALGVRALGSLSQVGTGSGVAVGGTAVGAGAAAVGATVGAAGALVGATVGAAVGAAGALVGATVGAGVGVAQAVRTRARRTRTLIREYSVRMDRTRFISDSSLKSTGG